MTVLNLTVENSTALERVLSTELETLKAKVREVFDLNGWAGLRSRLLSDEARLRVEQLLGEIGELCK